MKMLKRVLFIVSLTLGFFTFANTEVKAAGVINLRQTDADSNNVKVEWDCLTDFNSNMIELSTDNQKWSIKETNTYSSSTYQYIDALSQGQRYYLRVTLFSDYECLDPIAASAPIQICTTPKEPRNVRQTSATTSSIGLAWDASPGATSYSIYRYISYNNLQKVGQTNTNSITLSNLSIGTEFELYVYANASVGSFTTTSYRSGYKIFKTAPAKIKQLGISSLYFNINVIYFSYVNTSASTEGYHFEMYNSSKKKIHSTETVSTTLQLSLKKGDFQKYRVRPYITVNNRKVYGAWSDFKYFGLTKKISAKRAGKSNKIRLTWKKVKGAVSYTISGSTSETTGYKTIKKLSSKKNSLVISKIKGKKFKKGKRYYLRVVVTGKDGKKKITSPCWVYGSFYLY